MNKLKIFDAGKHKEISTNVCKILGVEPGNAQIDHFSDETPTWEIDENVRGGDLFVFQTYYGYTGEREKELYLLMDGLRSGAYHRLRVVMPLAFGSRSERRTRPKEPIESVVLAKNLKANGANGLLTVNIHAEVIGSIYDALDMLFDSLEFEPIASLYFAAKAEENKEYDFGLNSPDAGGMKRIRKVSKQMRRYLGVEAKLSMIDKYRPGKNIAHVYDIVGDVDGKVIGIYDDLGDTMGTLTEGAAALKERGAVKVFACYTHGVHSGPAQKRLTKALKDGTLDEILISDSLPLEEWVLENEKIKVVSVAPIIAEAIKQIHMEGSVSKLHGYEHVMALYKDLEF